jgi:hypothetical protein
LEGLYRQDITIPLPTRTCAVKDVIYVVPQISNSELTLQNIPDATAGIAGIWRFALTFNGYEYWGSFERCAEVANAPLSASATLTELRTRLFFEQRRYRHMGEEPREEGRSYLIELLDAMKKRVSSGILL